MLDTRYSLSTATYTARNSSKIQRGKRRLHERTAAATDNTAEIVNNDDSNIIYNYSSSDEDITREYKLPYKYIAEVAYDGTRYNGFQLQHNSKTPTVQGKLENALTRFLGISRKDLLLQGAGRTDAGVHARGQVVHFFSRRLLENNNTRAVLALNSLLPEDIHVMRLLRVPLDYNVRFSNGKIYTYDLHLDPLGSDPFTQRYRLCPKINSNFSLEALSSAAQVFLGSHDFSAFSSKPRDKSQRTPTRTIRRCEVVATPPADFLKATTTATTTSTTSIVDPLLRIEIEGDGFLYKQVRHMVGAMLAAASGRISPEDISKALADPVHRGAAQGGALARPGAYVLAEPHGLCLKKVFLPDPGNPEELMYGEQGPVLKRRSELLQLQVPTAMIDTL
jgi:tRNA pseudouridine38-40 synthase